MFRTELVKKLGGFREDFPVCEDYDLWLKICATEDVGFIPEPLIKKYGGHADQLSHRQKAMDELRVRAMWDVRNHPSLTLHERRSLFDEVVRKSEILIQGFEKHGHFAKAEEMRSVKNQSLDQVHHLNNAHSAAAFAPRSEDTVSLNGN